MRDLAHGLYELCPDCEGWGAGCLVCWDEGLVPHHCDPDPLEGDDPPTDDEDDYARR